jgi:hypothetical protein
MVKLSKSLINDFLAHFEGKKRQINVKFQKNLNV